jgi:hypothetical protein
MAIYVGPALRMSLSPSGIIKPVCSIQAAFFCQLGKGRTATLGPEHKLQSGRKTACRSLQIPKTTAKNTYDQTTAPKR